MPEWTDEELAELEDPETGDWESAEEHPPVESPSARVSVRFSAAKLGVLERARPEQAIDELVAATGAQERRRRRLPARLVVALVVALGLWARDGLRDVLANLVEGLRERDPAAWAGWRLPAKSALTQARQALGPRPLRVPFPRLA